MSDGMMPATGFGPGAIIIAIVGGILTFFGWILKKVGLKGR